MCSIYTMYNLEKFLNSVVKYGLYAILLTPLAFWPKALFPFLTPKFILFQILVEIVFAAWLILQMIDFRNQSRLRKNYIAIALSLFFAVSLISALFGVDFSRSFWGIGPRMTGLFAELHFFAWFLVLINYFKTKEEWNRYLNFSLGAAAIVALTAFYQNPKWGLSLGYGIFNNPTFVAPYLIFHFFWGLYQLFRKRWFFGAGATFLFAMILFAQIRGAVLGLIVGVFVFGLGLIFTNILSRRPKIILRAVYIFLIFGVAILWYLRDNPAIQKFSPIKRVTGISFSETTVQTRLLAWQIALKGFADRPFFGTGPENFNFLFNAHYNPKLLKLGGGGFGETWFDKPHNAFLQILTETGIVGAAAYILILTAIALALYKLWKNNKKLLTIFLASALTSYLVTVFFSFDSFGSWFGVYLFLALLASQNRDTNIQIHANDTNNTNKKNIISIPFVSLVIISILVSLLYFNYSIWRANVADADALRTFPRDAERGIALFKKSLNYFTPYKSEYQLDLFTVAGSAVQANYPLPTPEETINFVLAESDKMIAAHPKDAAYYTNLVKLYDIFGEKGSDPEIFKIAGSYGEKSLELSPKRQETLFYLIKNYILLGDTKSGVSYAAQAVSAEPSIGLSRWYLGLAYVADNQKDKGIMAIKNALELGYNPQNKAEENFIKNLGL